MSTTTVHKAQKNKDALIKLQEHGTETFRVDKRVNSSLNASAQSEKIYMKASGTALDGFGTYRSYYVQNDATAVEQPEAARIEVNLTDVSDGSEDAEIVFKTMQNGTLITALTINSGASLSGVGDLSFSNPQSVNLVNSNAAAWTIQKADGTDLLVFDTTNTKMKAEATLELQNTIDITCETSGGSDLGSTTAEWGDIFIGDSKSLKGGADQDWALTHDGTAGLNVVLKDNVASALDVKEGSNSLIKYVSTDNSEKLTIASVQDVEINAGQTATDSVKIQAYDVGAGANEALITATSHATTPTLALAASGGITISNSVTVANTMDIVAATSGGCDLGSSTGEWGDIYTGDSKAIKMGADQDFTVTHDGTKGVDVAFADNDTGALTLKNANGDSFLVFDSTTGSLQLEIGQKVEMADTMDIIPGASGGCDLGSTTAEWGDIFIGDSKSLKGGADQDWALTHDGTAGLNVVLKDNVASALDVKEGSNSLIKYVSTDNSEKLTIASVQDIEINSGETAADSVKIQAYDVGGGAQEALITCAAHATTPTLALSASGGITISGPDNSATAITFKEGSNTYLTFVTSDDAEKISTGKIQTHTVTAVDMANAEHTIILGTAGANQTKATGNVWFVDPNGGNQVLVLPAEASCTGWTIDIVNTADAAETITVQDDAKGYTVIALDVNQAGRIYCDGTTWYGFMGSET